MNCASRLSVPRSVGSLIWSLRWRVLVSWACRGLVYVEGPCQCGLMSNEDWTCVMQVLSISHQQVCSTVTRSLCSARDAIPMPVKSDRCRMGCVCVCVAWCVAASPKFLVGQLSESLPAPCCAVPNACLCPGLCGLSVGCCICLCSALAFVGRVLNVWCWNGYRRRGCWWGGNS